MKRQSMFTELESSFIIGGPITLETIWQLLKKLT